MQVASLIDPFPTPVNVGGQHHQPPQAHQMARCESDPTMNRPSPISSTSSFWGSLNAATAGSMTASSSQGMASSSSMSRLPDLLNPAPSSLPAAVLGKPSTAQAMSSSSLSSPSPSSTMRGGGAHLHVDDPAHLVVNDQSFYRYTSSSAGTATSLPPTPAAKATPTPHHHSLQHHNLQQLQYQHHLLQQQQQLQRSTTAPSAGPTGKRSIVGLQQPRSSSSVVATPTSADVVNVDEHFNRTAVSSLVDSHFALSLLSPLSASSTSSFASLASYNSNASSAYHRGDVAAINAPNNNNNNNNNAMAPILRKFSVEGSYSEAPSEAPSPFPGSPSSSTATGAFNSPAYPSFPQYQHQMQQQQQQQQLLLLQQHLQQQQQQQRQPSSGPIQYQQQFYQ